MSATKRAPAVIRRAYWRGIRAEARRSAAEFIKLKSVLSTVLVPLVGSFVLGWTAAADKVLWAGLAVGVLVIAAGATWVVSFFRAISQNHYENLQRIGDIERQRDELRRQAASTAKAEAKAEVQEAARRDLLNHLGQFLKEAEELERECVREGGSDGVNRKATAFYNKVAQYIDSNIDGATAAQFKVATPRTDGVPMNLPFEKTGLWRRICGRKEFLSQLITVKGSR